MNQAGDAAEQIVKMTLEGVEVAAKLTGGAAKEIAMLLIAALKSNDKSHLKLRGKERLNTMLKSGKPLEIYSIKESDLQKFVDGAKEYGIVYCVLRNSKNNPDGLCDILVKADDAPKIGRLAERFEFATVDKDRIMRDIVAEEAARATEPAQESPATEEQAAGTEPEAPDIGDTEKLLDDLMGTPEGKAEPDAPEQPEQKKPEPEKPVPAKGGKEQPDSPPFSRNDRRPHPSEPTSDTRKKPERATLSKPSVKEEIREITAARKSKETDAPKRGERQESEKRKTAPSTTTHKQPQRGRPKSKKSKGNR